MLCILCCGGALENFDLIFEQEEKKKRKRRVCVCICSVSGSGLLLPAAALSFSTPLLSSPLHSTPCLCWNDAHKFCCFVKFCIILFSIAIISVRDYPSCPNSVIFGRTPLSVPPLPFPPSVPHSFQPTYLFLQPFLILFHLLWYRKKKQSKSKFVFAPTSLSFLLCFALLLCVHVCLCVRE